jgi:hypothetical protein
VWGFENLGHRGKVVNGVHVAYGGCIFLRLMAWGMGHGMF